VSALVCVPSRLPSALTAARINASFVGQGGELLMIRGLHAMFYSSQADELRAFFRDKLGFRGTDVGGGW
jgi:hypothetical protein